MQQVIEKLYLTIDQGGHASRVLLFNHRGEVISEAYEEISTHCKNENWVEHDAEELITSINNAITKATALLDINKYQMHSAGLATQRASIVCWDRTTGKPLSPVISWQDRRAASWIANFDCNGSKIYQITGLYITAHYGVSKLRWCLDNLSGVKQAYAEGRLAWGPLASFIVFRLLEERPLLVDPANASRTLLWSRHTLDWDDDLVSLFNVPKQPLPDCVPTEHHYGHLRIGDNLVPLNIVTGDQSAALFAYGKPQLDAVYINLGTGAFLQRVFTQSAEYTSKLLTSIVAQVKDEIIYVLEGTVNGAGSAFVEVENQLGIDPLQAQKSLPRWLAKNEDVPLYLNGVSGLGSPFWVPDFNSTFVDDRGIDKKIVDEGEGWKKIVSVAESIVFLIAMNLEEMEKICSSPKLLIVTGGLSKNEEMCQRLSDLTGKNVFKPQACEATARGTAYLLVNVAINAKNNWSDKSTGQWIKPLKNTKFSARFILWKKEMLHVLKNY